MYYVKFNFAPIEAVVTRIMDIARNDSIPQVARTYSRELPALYAQGLGGDGKELPPYNSSYATRMGIAETPKTLEQGKGRLYVLVLEGDTLTVKDSDIGGTNSKVVAHGQQTGASGRWPYSNVMFAINEPIQDMAAHELAAYITAEARNG